MRKSRKEQGQFHTRPNIALRLAAILLMLVCLSVWLMNGLFAKYRTSDEGGDGARVISFNDISIVEKGDFANTNGTAIMIPGVDLTKNIEVEFAGSESATYVFVEMRLSKNWYTTDNKGFSAYSNALQFAVDTTKDSADNVWTYLTKAENDKDIAYIYYCVLEPNEVLDKQFIANGGKITVSSTITKAAALSVEDMNIDVRAIVVQSNGFASPEAAWDTIGNK